MASLSAWFGLLKVCPRPVWFFPVCSIGSRSLFRARFSMRVLRMQFLLSTCTLPSIFLEKKKRTGRHMSRSFGIFQTIFMRCSVSPFGGISSG